MKKSAKVIVAVVFFVFVIAVSVYFISVQKNDSDDSAVQESAVSCGDPAAQVLSGADEAYADAQELIGNADFDGAAERLESAIKEYPGEARLYNLLGQALMYKKDVERALAAFKKAVAFEPGNIGFIFDLASMQFKIELFEDSAATIEAVDPRNVDDPMQAVLAVNICLQAFLPEAGVRWSERALALLSPETETAGFILTRKALFLSMLGASDESIMMIDQMKFDPQNEEKLFLQATLKAGFIRWLGRKPGEREKMLADMAAQAKSEFVADTIRLSQALVAMEDSKWKDAADFLKKELPEPASSDSVTKVFHYLMRQGVNVIALDKTGQTQKAKELIEKMKNWCGANSNGAGRLLVARCQAVELLSKKNDVKEASEICAKSPPSLTAACLLNAGFGSEMNGDDGSAWELYSKSAGAARYNAFPRKLSRVLLKNINDSRKVLNEASR